MNNIKDSVEQYRNVGIIAHIDAGKTTTTERLLYFTKTQKHIGEVHEGKSTTDFLVQEATRGITIMSAAVSFKWNEHTINLIDTPGHIDFSIEVERASRVVDGFIVVLCAVGGVQPQTETVWMKTVNKPKIIYINKMDRDAANYEMVLSEIKERLEIIPFPVIVPIGAEHNFVGTFNLINKKITLKGNFNIGEYDSFFDETTINFNQWDEVELLNNFQSFKNEIIEWYIPCFEEMLQCSNDNEEEIKRKIKDKIQKLEISPVLCGSSLKNKGIKDLLNNLVDFLPHPEEDKNLLVRDENQTIIELPKMSDTDNFIGFVFKTVDDKYTGNLSYVRLFSGTLKLGDFLVNSRTKEKIRISKIIKIHADQREDLISVKAGDIFGLVCKNMLTGDTLCSPLHLFYLEQLQINKPVVFSAIEVNSKSDFDKLGNSLKRLSQDDPSFSFKIDHQVSPPQIIIAGTGKLQLEIMCSRLETEYNIKAQLKVPKVCYQETIESSVENLVHKHIKQTGGRGQYAHLEINLMPSGTDENIFESFIVGAIIIDNYVEVIKKTFLEECSKGILTNFSSVGIKMQLLTGSQHDVDSSELAFQLATKKILKEAFIKCNPILLEPIARVEVITPVEHLGNILSDIQSKRGEVINTFVKSSSSNRHVVDSLIPRSNLFDYGSDLRALSAGSAFFTSMIHHSFKKVPKYIQDLILEEFNIQI